MDCMNCAWSEKGHSHAIAAALTCGAFTPRERNAAPVADPDKCVKCGEFYTPRTTKGSIKCKCDVPRPPRDVLEEAANTPLPGQVRYGGRS